MFSPDFGVVNDLLMKMGFISSPISIYGNPSAAMIGVIVADAWTRIPFMTVIMLAAFLSVPRELYEAATVDGASSGQSFYYITMPLVKAPAVVGLMITTMFSFRTIDIIIPLTAGGPARSTYVFGYYIWDQVTKTLNFGMAAAAGIVLFILVAFITMGYTRLLRR